MIAELPQENVAEVSVEQAICFGDQQHLLGVWANGRHPSRTKTAFLMVTAGMLHCHGPYRLHNALARELSLSNIASFRFDLSGIGESFAIGFDGSSLDRASDEIRQAIDWIQHEHGIDQVVLFGLCSGADDAIYAAERDTRVAGVLAMDGCGYRTLGFYWHRFTRHYLPRLLSPQKWIARSRRILDNRRGPNRPQQAPSSLRLGDDIREFPDRETAEIQLAKLADRGVRLHFIYTDGVGDYFNHAGQFDAMFPKLRGNDCITHRFFHEMDHVAYLVEDRQRLIEHVVETVQSMTAVNNIEARGTTQPMDAGKDGPELLSSPTTSGIRSS